MRGTIEARGPNKWRVRIFLGRDEQGKQRVHSKTITGKRSVAEAYAAKQIHTVEFEGALPLDRKATFADALKTWWSSKQHELNARTHDAYLKELRLYVTPRFGHLKLMALTRETIRKMYDRMLAEGVSPSILRRTHMHVGAILRRAYEDGKLPSNPALGIKLPPVRHRPKIVFTPTQAARFAAALNQHPDRALFLLALETGLRPSEYLALRWSDLNWASSSLTVQRTVYRRPGTGPGTGWIFSTDMKTPASRRNLPLSPFLLAALREISADAQPDDLIFHDGTGNPYHPGRVRQRIFKPVLRAAGLDTDMRLYDLRHSCATLLLDAATNVRVVAERLGHSSAAITLAVYAHVLPGRQNAATETLAQIIGQQQDNNPDSVAPLVASAKAK